MSHLFQSTRPVWGATGSARADWLQERLFQSTRPVWGATKGFIFYRRNNIFQSTRPVWGATYRIVDGSRGKQISIHAPRVGRDGETVQMMIDAG